MTVTKKHWMIFLSGFVLANVVMTGLFLGFVLVNRHDLPALRFSTNVSLNEKVRWLQRHLANQGCDTLVIGSSMALNGIDYHELEAIGLSGVTNAGAWSLGVPQTLRLLEAILPRCKPKTIIYPVYFGDFEPADAGSDIDFTGIASYIARTDTGDRLLDYIAEIDPYDLIRDFRQARSRARNGHSVYETLEFDASGAALLGSEHFRFEQRRWEGYRYSSIRTNDGSLRAFDDLTRLALANGIRLVVAEVPLRAPSISVLGRDRLLQWQDAVQETCRRNRCLLVPMPEPGEFGDALFADFAHLNENGVRLWTRHIAETIASSVTFG